MEELLQLLLYKRNALATFLGQVRHFKMASDLPQNGKNVGMLVFQKTVAAAIFRSQLK